MNWFSQIRGLWHTMGAARFLLFFGLLTSAIIAYGLFVGWAGDRIGWPEAYGFQCHGRKGCIFVQLAHSYKLLQTPTADELLLFAVLWAIIGPAILAALFIVVRRKWAAYQGRIRPFRPDQ